MGAHYFIRDSEMFYEWAKSADKDFIVIEGATAKKIKKGCLTLLPY